MLSIPKHHVHLRVAHRQRGVVLIIALIALVSMSLAGVALVRSVDTSNVIAGNLAFKQSATSSGDSGLNEGITWLQGAGSNTFLDVPNKGYLATCPSTLGANQIVCNPGANQTWAQWWSDLKTSCLLPGTVCPVDLAKDSAGNTVSYIIQRMCQSLGTDPTNPNYGNPNAPTGGATGCARATASSGMQDGISHAIVRINEQFTRSNLLYYRVTARIAGTNNTVSFVQAFVAQP